MRTLDLYKYGGKFVRSLRTSCVCLPPTSAFRRSELGCLVIATSLRVIYVAIRLMCPSLLSIAPKTRFRTLARRIYVRVDSAVSLLKIISRKNEQLFVRCNGSFPFRSLALGWGFTPASSRIEFMQFTQAINAQI